MYRCVLVPVDGTAFGEQALALAATVARRTGAALHLAHVHVPAIAPVGMDAVAAAGPWNDILKEQENDYLEKLAQRVSAAFGPRVTWQVMDGPVAEAVESQAAACGADLVVMSTHGHAGFRRVWHHCIAEQLLQELPIPVLLTHPRDEEAEPDLSTPRELRHVLVPLDGGAQPHAMLERATALGRGFRARYTLLRVVHPPAATSRSGADNQIGRRSLEHDQVAARQYLTGFAERMRAAGLDVRSEVRVDEEPASAIVRFIAAAARAGTPVDLVAMERHPHRGLANALATHTTNAVVRDGGVPVLLVRSATPATSPAQLASLAVQM
jgi:nucleotide-binding universal stress UspA family protein